MEQVFYMCFVDGESAPQKKHDNLINAEFEAARLTKLIKKRVYVLEAKKYVELVDIKWSDMIKPEDMK